MLNAAGSGCQKKQCHEEPRQACDPLDWLFSLFGFDMVTVMGSVGEFHPEQVAQERLSQWYGEDRVAGVLR